jgi:hypothetical protein
LLLQLLGVAAVGLVGVLVALGLETDEVEEDVTALQSGKRIA